MSTFPSMSRRSLLASGGSLAAGAVAASVIPTVASAAGGPVTIVTDGQPNAVIVTGLDPAEQITAAAQTLSDYIAKATGAVLPIVAQTSAPSTSGPVQIHLGESAPGAGARVSGQTRSIERDGFTIVPTANTISIVGNDDYGTRFGAYDFLERYLGIRWLLPTDGGEHIPQHSTVTIPARPVKETPDIYDREVSAMMDPFWMDWRPSTPSRNWGNHNRIRESTKPHHVLGRIFDPAVYAKPNLATFREDLFPILNGERVLPTAQLAGWQPRLTADDTVDIAVDYSRSYLNQYPQFTGYSLSLNDDGDWSEDEYDQSVRNSIGALHASELYYAWVNEVAARMELEFPDATCGTLAYITLNDPPAFKLHPKVKVFLTYDRYGWVDPVQRQRDIDNLDAWRDVTDNIGWYDYAYGGAYAVPRMYLTTQAEAYKYAAGNGVTDMYIEQRPGWDEGPKPWMTAKLMWDTSLDPVELSTQWCNTAVGEAAGQALFDFYQGWENLWVNDVPQSHWMKNQPRALHYIPFNWTTDHSYLDVFTPEKVAPLAALMETVQQLAVTPEQQARADALALTHALSVANAESYPRPAVIDSASTAMDVVDDLAQHADERLEATARRATAWAAITANPILSDSAAQSSIYTWTGWNFDRVTSVAKWVIAHPSEAGPVIAQVDGMLTDPSASVKSYGETMRALIDGATTSLGEGMDFSVDAIDAWTPSPTSTTRETAGPISGGFRMPGGPRRYRMLQTVPGAAPGYAGLELDLSRLDTAPTAGLACLEMTALDSTGKSLVRFRARQFPLDDITDQTRTIGLYENLPAETVQVRLMIDIQGLAWDATLLLREARLTQLA